MFEKENEQKVIYTMRLMDKITDLYMSKHNMNFLDFLEFDKKRELELYILRNPEVFAGLTDEEMLEKAEEYINHTRL